MTDLMHSLLTITLTGSALALVLALLGRVVKNKLPKAAVYYLWLLVLLRLALPWSLPGAGVELPQPEVPQKSQVTLPLDIDPEAIQIIQGDPISVPEGMEKYAVAAGAVSLPWHIAVWRWVCGHFAALWLAGAGMHLLWFTASYRTFRRTLANSAAPLQEQEQALLTQLNGGRAIRAFRSGAAQTPMVVGLLRPAIVLPDVALDSRQLEYIARHELTHVRRKDLWFKWAAVLVTSFHWFNPLMPWLRREISRWCELSCDEAVVGALDDGEKEAYGRTLLALASAHALPRAVPATTLVEEKGRLKERLAAILTFKQATVAVLALCCALAVLFTGCAGILGVAQKQPEPRHPGYVPPDWVEMPADFVTTLTDEQLAAAVEQISQWMGENAPELTEPTLYLAPYQEARNANIYTMFSLGLYCVDAGAGEIKPLEGMVEDAASAGMAFLRGGEGGQFAYSFYLSRTGRMNSLDKDLKQLKAAFADTAQAHPEARVDQMQVQLREGTLEYAQVGFDDGDYRFLFYNAPTGLRHIRTYDDRAAEASPVKPGDLPAMLDALMDWQREQDPANAQSFNASYSAPEKAELFLKAYTTGSDTESLGLAQYSLSAGTITRVEDPARADCSGGMITLLYPARQPTWFYLIGE